MLSRTHVPAALLAAVLLSATLGGVAGAPGTPATASALPVPAAPLLLEELLALAGVEGETGLDPEAFQALLGARAAGLGSPAAAVADAEALLAALRGADTATAAYAAAAGAGLPGLAPAAHGPASLRSAMVGLYLRMGVLPTATTLAGLDAAVARLDAPAASALGAMVASSNLAIDAVRTGTAAATAAAAGDLLATIEANLPALSGPATTSSHDCSADPIFVDPNDMVIIEGTCDHSYTHHYVLLVDLGGDELYQNRPGGATTQGSNDPLSVNVDLGHGQDTYADSASYTQGAGLNAIGILLDDGGSDTYTANMAAQGSATGGAGVGVLADLGGDDTYSGGRRVQGSGDAGFLLDLGNGQDSYTAATASQGGRFVPFPSGTVPAMLFDQAGADSYTGTGLVQGAGNFLVDGAGDDTYTATGALVPNAADGFAQGTALGANDGFLIDGSGDDTYTADIYAAQGFGIGLGLGALMDFGGADSYTASNYGQATCTGIDGRGGLLLDASGNDRYTAGSGQGSARAFCGAYLLDGDGDDTYVAGDFSQGVSASLPPMQPLVGILIDARGHDSYTAGATSQGAGADLGVALFLDADGTDALSAGAGSQGSGHGGVGILVDGLQDAASIDLDTSGSLSIASPGDEAPAGPAKADRLEAGDLSQGSGSAGGVGLLVDNDDETVGGGLPHRATYTAGDLSQGSGSTGGVGALVNREGRDGYSAGAGSQGSAIDAPLGVLADLSGRDAYQVPDPAVSRGYGASSPSWAALGLLVDGGGNDAYSPPAAGDNACEAKGQTGLTVDAELPFVPASCLGAAASAAGSFAGAVEDVAAGVVATALAAVADALETVDPPSGGSGPCVGGEYFCDDVEGGNVGWTPNTSLNQWQLVDQDATPNAAGVNAQSGTHYWYVGGPYPGATYFGNEDTVSGGATLTSPVIDLTTAATPQLTVSVAGGSEAGFDILHVRVADAAGVPVATLGSFTGQSLAYQTATFSLAAYAGSQVTVQFSFITDLVVEEGPGWNVDDIRVAEP